jgi:peptidoglycan/LPS O-acetylase OafA/YrhL
MNGKRKNNFDPLRLVLASLVIISHSFTMVHTTWPEPLAFLTKGQMDLGGLAVDAFFTISGSLIAASWVRSRGLADYARKRILRIYPGFLVCCLFSVFILAPIGQPRLASFFASFPWPTFVKNALLLNRIELPRSFSPPPWLWDSELNGSLWTIKIEFECYILIALLGLAGLLKKRHLILGLTLLVNAAYVLSDLQPDFLARSAAAPAMLHFANHFRFCSYFLLGTCAWLFSDRIRYTRLPLALAVVSYLVGARLGCGSIFMPWALAFMLFYVAFHPRVSFGRMAQKRDLSYGVYLYGWPMQRVAVMLVGRQLNPYLLTLTCAPLVLITAFLSWTFVEEPALALKSGTRVVRASQQPG